MSFRCFGCWPGGNEGKGGGVEGVCVFGWEDDGCGCLYHGVGIVGEGVEQDGVGWIVYGYGVDRASARVGVGLP